MTEPTIADGTLEHADGQVVIRFVRRLAHPIDSVWASLTEPERMIGWWGSGDVDLVEGGRFAVRWLNTDDDGEVAVMEATITELDPPRLLETSGGMHGTLRWELESDGDATVLRFTATGELPAEFESRNIAGWHTHLDALATTLEGGSVDLVNIEPLWEPVHEAYVARR